jgi:quinol monooxygenase YgiN
MAEEKSQRSPVVAVQNCGNIGLAAIKSLVARGGCKVRTASRNPDKLKSTKLAGLDVEVFQTGDDALFAGVNRFVCIPPGPDDPDQRAALAIAFAEKCNAAGATHGSLVSVVVADPVNRRGLFGAQFGVVEDALRAMDGTTSCFIRAPFFIDNMWGDVDTVKSMNTFFAPVPSDAKQLSAAAADIAEAVVVAALDAGTAGKAFFVLGDHLSKAEVAALYSEKLGRAVTHTQASAEAATQALLGFGFKQWQIDGILELNQLNDSAAFMAAHAGEFEALTGKKPTTVSQYMDAALIPAIAGGPPKPNTHPYTMLSICPTFTVVDWDKAKPIMEDFVARTKTEAGCVYYGWTKTGNSLKCREMYKDGAAVNAHLENVGPCIQALLAEGVATLDDINIQGPADQLEIVKPGTEALGTTYFATDGGFTNMSAAVGDAEVAYDLVTIHPTFTVADWDKAKPIMEDFVTRTKTEPGCVYYGWVRDGDKLKCREGYADGAAVNAHLANVGACIQAILAEGVAILDSISIHGPADQLELVKPGTEALGTKYYATDGGFSKYAYAAPARLDLVSVYNQTMYCWEHGLEDEYKALVVPDLVLDIAAFNSTTTGVDAIWGFRQYVATQMAGVGGNDPLTWINTHSTHKVNGNQVNAYMKSYHLATGNLEQLGEWSVDFNEHGLVTKMTQRVLWRGDGNAGPPGGEAAALSLEPSTDNLVSAYNSVMFAWEQGREDAYRALTADGIKMTIPAFGQEVEGQDAIWKFREYVATEMAQIDANAPLPWINTHDTFSVDQSTNTVVAYMKSFTVGAAGEAGKLVQLGEWVVTFDDSGKCTTMLQKVLWRGDGNAGPAGGGPTPICSDPSSGSDVVSKYTAVMLAWSSGNEAAYKKLTADQIHMTIPAFQSDTTGQDAIWGFRQYVAVNFGGVGGNDKLPWINTHDTFVVHDNHVDAYMKSFSTTDGSLQQVGRWTVSFGDDGKCESMHQDVLWRKPAPGGEGVGESKGESEGEAPVRIRQPSVLTSQHPARSCRITSHTTTKTIRYSFEIKGIASPWSPKEGATEIGGGIVVVRRFREFQAVYRTMARQAKANGDIAAPPRMPDGGGAVMWFRRHSAKTIERRETRFNEILEYMIKTPVINEHEAVMEFLGLNFAPPAE